MTRKRNYYKSITIHFTNDEMELADDFFAEAEKNGAKSLSDYAKMLVVNHDTRGRIVMDTDTEMIRQRYEAKIDILKEQLDELQKRFIESAQSMAQNQSLQGVERAQLSVDEQVSKRMDEFRKELAHEQLKKDKAALEKELAALEAEREEKIEELEAELEEKEKVIEDLEDQIKGHVKSLSAVEMVKGLSGPAISYLTNRYPGINQTIDGLMGKGLGALNPSTNFVEGLNEDEKRQFEYGKSIEQKFTVDERIKIQRILDYFYQHKESIDTNISIIARMSNPTPTV